MEDALYLWSSLLLGLGVPTGAVFAALLQERLVKRAPTARPYFWGYFTGVLGTAAGFVYCVYFAFERGTPGWVSVLFGLAALGHLLVIFRCRVGWLISVPLQANPILWVINTIYARNRWSEFSWGPAEAVALAQSWGKHTRVAASLAAGWPLVVGAYVLVFDPYGGYVNSQETWQLMKLLFIPPVVASILYALYRFSVGKSDV